MSIINKHRHNHYSGTGVGLAIVASLDLNSASQIISNHFIFSNPPSPRSDPIPVLNTNANSNEEEDDDESFTYVTYRQPTESPVTRIYHDLPAVRKPIPFSIDNRSDVNYECSDFLSSCDLCRKNLAGEDIFMYRGEKAFCSDECRQRQIESDERKEKMSRRASKAVVSRSPCYYETGHIFSTGIISTY